MFLLFFVFYVKAALVQGNGLEQQNGGHGMHEVSLFFLVYQLFTFLFVNCLFTKISISAVYLRFHYFCLLFR